MEFLEKFFKLKEKGTNVKTEVLAGVTTFMAMAYILAVNPDILSATGMNKSGVFVATVLSSFIACLCMAFMGNLPFVLSSGMGLNAFFTYTVVLKMGCPWEWALAAVFAEGIIFIILSITNVREAIFNCIPASLKAAVTVGIGLFITLIGLKSAKIIVSNPATLVSMNNFSTIPFNEIGITVLLSLFGIIVTFLLVKKGVKGGILYGIFIVWILAIICELTGLFVPGDPLDGKIPSVVPDLSRLFDISHITSIKYIFGGCFKGLKEMASLGTKGLISFLTIMFTFLFVDVFDTLGTIIGVATKANMIDNEGKLPGLKGALLADAVGTTAGAVLGTSTVTTFVESATGVAEGGKTGLVSLVAGLLFLVSIIFAPLFIAIPSFATAPALVVVGFLMMQAINRIDFYELGEAIPAFLCIIMMPFSYSVADGIGFGMISYSIINLIGGKKLGFKKENIHPVLFVCAILFLLKYIRL